MSSDTSGLVLEARQVHPRSAPSARLYSGARPPAQPNARKKRSFFSKLFCCGVKKKPSAAHRRTESLTPSLPSLMDIHKTEPIFERPPPRAIHKDSIKQERRVVVEVDPEDIVLSSRSPSISQVPSNAEVKIGASFNPPQHVKNSSRMPEIEDDPAPRLNSSAFKNNGKKATRGKLEAHSQPNSLLGSPKRIGKRPEIMLSPPNTLDGRRVETVSKMEGISNKNLQSSHDYRSQTLNDQTDRTVGSKPGKAGEQRSVFSFKPHLSQVGLLQQSSRNFLSQLGSRGGSKQNAKVDNNNTASFRPQSQIYRVQVQSTLSSPLKEYENQYHSSSGLQLIPQPCLPNVNLQSAQSTLRQPSYRQPHLQDALSRLEELSKLDREKIFNSQDSINLKERISKVQSSQGRLEGRGVLAELPEKIALQRRILHPSTGDHISVGISGKNATNTEGGSSQTSKHQRKLFRSSGSATYRKKGESKMKIQMASASERNESRSKYHPQSKQSSLKILGSEEGSFSEVVISDSDGQTIKQSPRGGIGSRGAGKGESATTQHVYGTHSDSTSGKMYQPRATDPSQILPSGTERSLTSPLRTPQQRGEDVISSEFALPSMRNSSKEEFGFYSSLKHSKRGGQGLLESTNSFGPILRQYQPFPSTSRISKSTGKQNPESTPSRQSETSQEQIKRENIESASHFTPSSNKQSIESSRESQEMMVRRGVVEQFNPQGSSFNFFTARDMTNPRDTSRSISVKRSISGFGSFMRTELDTLQQSQQRGLQSFSSSRLPALLHHASSNYSELQQLRQQMAMVAQGGESWNPLLNELLCNDEVKAVNLNIPEMKQNWMKCQLFLEEQNLQLQQGYHEFEQLKHILQKENKRILALQREYREACGAHQKEQSLFNEIAATKILQCPGS